MRYLVRITFVTAAASAFAGCGTTPHRPTATASAAPSVTPARDLADARSTLPEVPPRDAHAGLPARDPRVVDLDIIRITAHAAPGGEPELTAVASADLFKQANAAAKAGRPRDAIATYRQLVAEFPESQFAPVALFNIAALYDAQADLPATLAALTELVAACPAARESIEGHLYIAALQADHQRWADAATTLDAVLARANLTFADRIEAFARKGYVELE